MSKEIIEQLEAARRLTTEGEWKIRAMMPADYFVSIYKGEWLIADRLKREAAAAVCLFHNSLPELLEYVKGLERVQRERLDALLEFIEEGRSSEYVAWRECDKETMLAILNGGAE